MRIARLGLAMLFCGLTAPTTLAQTPEPWTLAKLGVDPASPIESRFGAPPSWMVDLYAQQKQTLVSRAPTDTERGKFAAALDALTPLQRQYAQERLKSISIVSGMENNANTSREMCQPPCSAFNMIISDKVFGETVSEFLTRKEKRIFDTTGSTLDVHVEGGSMDALTFVLAHEVTHMIDMAMRVTPQAAPSVVLDETNQKPFTDGVWAGLRTYAPAYRSELLESSALRTQGKVMPVAQARDYYEALKRTPFVSSYAAVAYLEDICELVAARQLTEKLKQPYRIEIRDAGKVIYSYEPMANPLVRERLKLLDMFDRTDG